MRPSKPRQRMSAVERREQIIQAVLPLFGQRGRDGVTTKELAAVGGVSEALIFRHFPTKQDLFDALLSHHTQAAKAGHPALREAAPPSTRELVRIVCLFVHYVVYTNATKDREMMRLYYRSFTEDGAFARDFLKLPNVRKVQHDFVAALQAARHAGDALPVPTDPLNLFWFMQHTVNAACLVRLANPPVVRYDGADAETIPQLVNFVLRGIGLKEKSIRLHATARNFTTWWQDGS